MRFVRLYLAVIGCLLTLSPGVMADEGSDEAGSDPSEAVEQPAWQPPEHRLFYRNLTVARINPKGFQNRAEFAYRYRLFDSDSILFRESYVGVAVLPMITPAFSRIGISAQLQPLAALYLEARWHFVGWYGVMNHPTTFADTDGDYSDTAIEAADDSKATTGWEVNLVAEARAKIGPVVLRDRLTVVRTELDQPSGSTDPFFYSPLFDLLLPTSGWALSNDADLLVFLLNKQLIVGTRYSLGHVFHDTVFKDIPTHRIGPLVAYKFIDDPGSAFDAATALVLMQWYLKHPYRTGQDVSQAVPYIAIGFAFQGDLL